MSSTPLTNMKSNTALTSQQIRQKFLDFFASKDHSVLPSSPVVPQDDPTLMFTNAGMNQFKGIFLGENPKGLKRATTSQKCIRAGGKHNDLENVGMTARHLTFFEMLGNFSFGDYFKREAIHYAWEFLTSAEWLNIPSEKLMVTVYASDDEAFDIWNKEVGVAAEKIVRIGDNKGAPYASDNFWQMGDTGPCGPCSEIFYDHGDHIFGGPPGSPDEDGDRFIEIWNNVFMQFNRDESGKMNPLPKQSVDTGMGLERITAVLQGSNSNYDTDVFKALLAKIAELTGVAYVDGPAGVPHRVISDHIRTISFAIADGVMPSNEGRGYVIRRILRRASRYARGLGQKEAFLVQLLPTLVELMGSAYPEIKARVDFITQVIRAEEERFIKTLDIGLNLLDKIIAETQVDKLEVIPGDKVFTLYDTFGFPADLTRLIAKEQNLDIDEVGFEEAMKEQKVRARAARKEGPALTDESGWSVISEGNGTEFLGYEISECEMKISRFRIEDDLIYFVSPQTPFYAESGGQVGEKGVLSSEFLTLQVIDTMKFNDMWLHKAHAVNGEATLESMAQTFSASVDLSERNEIRKNHSATHLLHAALRQVLGDHVTQQGSRVDSKSLRFDFSQPNGLTAEQVAKVEDMVNDQIQKNLSVTTAIQNIDQAKEAGAMALFGEKYDSDVRVVSMGEFSMELCGGFHVTRTGDIGLFRIRSEMATAAGVRRIEAVSGKEALVHIDSERAVIVQLQSQLKCRPEQIAERLQIMIENQKKLEKEIEKLGEIAAQQDVVGLKSQSIEIAGVGVVVHSYTGLDKARFSKISEGMGAQFEGISVLSNADAESGTIAVTVSKALTSKIKAGDLVNKIAALAGGKGGGRPDRAQAGTKEIEKIASAMSQSQDIIRGVLA